MTWAGQYEAWGTRTKEWGEDRDRQRANTKEEDPTGLLCEGMRYRDLESGVFTSPDPLGMVDGPNLYAYVNDNPWTHFDPEGLWAESEHFYTTYAVAGAAGVPADRVFNLAYYSQIPDEVDRYDASIVDRDHYAVKYGGFAGGPVTGGAGMIISSFDKVMGPVQRDIHFLRGSDNAGIIKARNNIGSAIQGGEFKGDAGMGFAIHTLGDAYAHTKITPDGTETGYATGWGHARDIHAPDQITSSPEKTAKYTAYVNQLYTALGGKGRANASKLGLR